MTAKVIMFMGNVCGSIIQKLYAKTSKEIENWTQSKNYYLHLACTRTTESDRVFTKSEAGLKLKVVREFYLTFSDDSIRYNSKIMKAHES